MNITYQNINKHIRQKIKYSLYPLSRPTQKFTATETTFLPILCLNSILFNDFPELVYRNHRLVLILYNSIIRCRERLITALLFVERLYVLDGTKTWRRKNLLSLRCHKKACDAGTFVD